MQETEQARQTVVGAAEQMMPFTTTHLVGIAIFAVIVILAIAWGMRMRARRRAAERELEEIGQSRRVEPGAAVADPDAPGAAIAVERRTPVEPTDIPAPAPPPVQAPRSAAPVEPAAPAAAAASAPVVPAPVEVPAPVADAAAPAPVAEPSAPAPTEPAPLVSPVAPVPVPTAPVAPAAPASAPSTNELTTLKGLGPKVAAQLAERGFTSVADLAALTPAEAERLDASLGAFQGRMARDRWIEQAQLLTAGDRAGYEAKFGKLG